MNMTRNYTAGKNNGQIASSADAVTGETVASNTAFGGGTA
jgi:hypothetical protein